MNTYKILAENFKSYSNLSFEPDYSFARSKAKRISEAKVSLEIAVFSDLKELKKELSTIPGTQNLVKGIKGEDDFQTFSVPLSSLFTQLFLYFPKSISNFKRHELIRKNIKNVKNFEQIIINLKKCKVNEERILEDIYLFLKFNAWTYPKMTQKKAKAAKVIELWIFSTVRFSRLTKFLDNLDLQVEANFVTRTLAELAPNMLHVDSYVDFIKSYQKKNKSLKLKVYDYDKLEKMGAGCFTAVSRASRSDSKQKGAAMVVLEYNPSKKKATDLALVGKGLCYDSGGYNVKTGNYMRGMKRDMTGSAVAFSVFNYLVQSGYKGYLKCYLGISENHISPDAFKMDEVLSTISGKTVEVIHTDAEGRMVLTDVLSFVSKEGTKQLIDFATLTGTAVRAIGVKRGTLFVRNEDNIAKALSAGAQSGERVWNFPIGDEYTEDLKESTVADLYQCSTKGYADHIYAASYLSEFVDPKIDWCHLDLSPDTCPGGLGLVSSEVTGFGVRWAIEYIQGRK